MNIALVGYPGSGKSAIAQLWGHRISFAWALKVEVAGAILGGSGFNGPYRPEVVHNVIKDMEEHKELYRTLYQWWGTEYRRGLNPDYWVNRMEKQLVRLENNSVYDIAVDDCRFPNEYEFLKSRGFLFVRLHGGPHERKLTAAQKRHESEKHWPKFDIDLEVEYDELAAEIEAIKKGLGHD